MAKLQIWTIVAIYAVISVIEILFVFSSSGELSALAFMVGSTLVLFILTSYFIKGSAWARKWLAGLFLAWMTCLLLIVLEDIFISRRDGIASGLVAAVIFAVPALCVYALLFSKPLLAELLNRRNSRQEKDGVMVVTQDFEMVSNFVRGSVMVLVATLGIFFSWRVCTLLIESAVPVHACSIVGPCR
jgi:hypothetical protein